MGYRRIRKLLLSLALIFVSSGCGGGARSAASAPGYGGGADSVAISADSDAPPPEPMDEASSDTMTARPSPTRQAPPPARATLGAPVSKDARGEADAKHYERPQEAQPPKSDEPKAPGSQLLIYTADIRVSVVDVNKSIDAVEKLAKDRGGYLVSREDNRITIRVPTRQLEAALDELGKLGEVLQRNVSVQDVTDLYFDLEVRMRNLEVVRKRLDELLAKATTVSEALAVQRELERVNGELERLKGKLKLIRELVLFSTITVVFQPRNTEHIDSRVRLPFPWMDRLGLGDLLRLD